MSVELQPLPADPPARREAAGPIRRGAQLVHLCEQLHLRMFALALVPLGAAGVFSVPLAQANPLEQARPLTVLFSAVALLVAACGLARRRRVYLWLRRNPVRQLTPGMAAAAIVLADGPYSPCWWIATALLLMTATFATAGPTLIAGALIAGALTAGAYAAGTLLRGSSLLPAGDSEYLTVTDRCRWCDAGPSLESLAPRRVHPPGLSVASAARGLVAYTNTESSLLAPSGMRCFGIIAGDGGSQVIVWPQGHRRPGFHLHSAGLAFTLDPACVSCKADDACPFFSSLARQLRFHARVACPLASASTTTDRTSSSSRTSQALRDQAGRALRDQAGRALRDQAGRAEVRIPQTGSSVTPRMRSMGRCIGRPARCPPVSTRSARRA